MAEIAELKDAVNDLMASRSTFTEAIDKSAFLNYIEELNTDLLTSRGVFAKLVSSATKVKKRMEDKSIDIKSYEAYVNRLNTQKDKRAAVAEKNIPFSTILSTTETYIEILEEIQKNFNTLFTSRAINLFNTRVSHVIVIGVLEEAKTFSEYSKYLLASFISGLLNLKQPAKYQAVYLQDNVQRVSTIVARTVAKTGSYNFQAMIKDLKSKALDHHIISEVTNMANDDIQDKDHNLNTKHVIESGTHGIIFFETIGSIYISSVTKMKKARQTKLEWMEAHVAALMLQLDELEEGSEEYDRLKKIIDRYNDLIADLDKKLNQPK